MATYTPVPVDVRIFAAATFEAVQCGAALSQGQCLYYDQDDDRYKLAQSDTQKKAKAVGFAFSKTTAANEWFAFIRTGTIGLGVALPIGAPLIVSSTAGKLCDAADAAAGWWITIVGIPETADKLPIKFTYSTVAKA